MLKLDNTADEKVRNFLLTGEVVVKVVVSVMVE